MGYPDVQDGQARHIRAGTGVPGGPVPDETPDTEQPGYGLPAAPGPVPGSRGGHRAHRAAPGVRPGPPPPASPAADARPASPRPPGAHGRAGTPPAQATGPGGLP